MKVLAMRLMKKKHALKIRLMKEEHALKMCLMKEEDMRKQKKHDYFMTRCKMWNHEIRYLRNKCDILQRQSV